MVIHRIVPSVRCTKYFVSATPSCFARRGGVFDSIKRHRACSSGVSANNLKGKTTSNSFRLSTVAAASLVGMSVARYNNGDSSSNVARCDVKKELSSEIFPEEALRYDTYNGVTVNVSKLDYDDVGRFCDSLRNSVNVWKEKGKRGLWIHIPTKNSAFVPHCVELGFEFQYAKNGLLVMTRWLPENQTSRLPHGPTTQVGIGAVIIHPLTKKMLVVQEKTGPAAARGKLWKMPTGLVDPGEDIAQAAVREAAEETGLECTFDRIVCMRHAHGGIFGQSDMFFVCLLRLAPKYHELLKEGREIELVKQEEEIAAIDWMEMDRFGSQDLWTGSPLYTELNDAVVQVVDSMVAEKGGSNSGKEMDGSEGLCGGIRPGDSQPGLIGKSLPLGYRPGEQMLYTSRL
eukprot:CAMPEP_0194289492 /NCGR_PEP_ID=MMETSP0169-20130528/39161_1 /TAXON_ID=218684 /ORGANISM="Corethron pennatum, Strain L29A3" /LENGTH=400 /DNA_ID=CAMNT_0039036783 /DNA_START=97 /DNA_END=1299 /DNA_ORIENTATION=+